METIELCYWCWKCKMMYFRKIWQHFKCLIRVTIWIGSSTYQVNTQEKWKHMPTNKTSTKFWEITQKSISWLMDGMIYPYNGRWLGHKREWSANPRQNMDDLKNTIQKKANYQYKRPSIHMIPFIGNVKHSKL